MKLVVVGGVAGGASAAVKARRTDEHAEIVMLERGEFVSWANCGLPYFVGDDIKQRDDLILVTEERFDERFNIKVKTRHEVTEIDRVNKLVKGINLREGTAFSENYDKLILAPGGRPVRPAIPGIDLKGIFTVTTIPEAEQLKAYLTHGPVKSAVVVGAGFIGLETLEALLNWGIELSLVEGTDHVLPIMDSEMVTDVHKYLASEDVRLYLNEKVVGFAGEERVTGVQLASGSQIAADLVVLAIGVAPESKLARESDLEIGTTGGILVNDRMQTSDPDIYAAGDAVETTHWVTGGKVRIALAGPANKQGRVAGANAVGGEMKYSGAAGSSIVKIGDMVAGKTGLSEAEAVKIGLPHLATYVHPANHAGYYPGGKGMTLKVIVEEGTGLLLGAQAVGSKGIDKRIDVLASAIYGRMNVTDLENLDLCYAPPFASAKDPVIMAGFVAANILRGEVKALTPKQLAALMQQGEEFQVIDVRTTEEFQNGHISGAISLPLDELRHRWQELDASKMTVVNCGVGYRSYLAYKILEAHGFAKLFNLSGGMLSWIQWVDRGKGF